MKKVIGIFLAGMLLLLPVFVGAQQSDRTNNGDVKLLLQDKTQAKRLIDAILKDPQLREDLINRLAEVARRDAAVRARLQTILSAPATAKYELPQIIIKFKPGAASSQIEKFVTGLGLQQVRAVPQLNMKVYRVPPGKTMNEVIAECKKQPFIEYAEPDQKVRTLREY